MRGSPIKLEPPAKVAEVTVGDKEDNWSYYEPLDDENSSDDSDDSEISDSAIAIINFIDPESDRPEVAGCAEAIKPGKNLLDRTEESGSQPRQEKTKKPKQGQIEGFPAQPELISPKGSKKRILAKIKIGEKCLEALLDTGAALTVFGKVGKTIAKELGLKLKSGAASKSGYVAMANEAPEKIHGSSGGGALEGRLYPGNGFHHPLRHQHQRTSESLVG